MEGIIILRLDFTKRSLGTAYKWWVQIPEGRGHRTVGFSNSRKSKSGDTGIDLTIDNLVRDGAPITIHITQPRSDLEVYDATVDGIVVARATRFKAGPKFEFSSWQVEVAKGFDLTLGVGICRMLAWHPLTRDWVTDEIRSSFEYSHQGTMVYAMTTSMLMAASGIMLLATAGMM